MSATATGVLEVEEVSGVPVVRVGPRRLFLEAAEAFREELLQIARESASSVVVDLTNVNVMNSSALGALILASDTLRKRGMELVVANPGPVLRQVLSRTKLDTILTVAPSVEEALALVSRGADAEPSSTHP